MVLDFILNPIFGPLLNLPPLWALLVITLVLSVFITYVYKWMTDQKLMKTLKEDIKKFQDEMKQFKDNPTKVLEIQKKAMETNMKYMMNSMKPTLVTFIPLLIIFGWLSGHLAYEPISPGVPFTTTAVFDKAAAGEISLGVPEGVILISDSNQEIVDGKAMWKLKGDAGEYVLEYSYNDKIYTKDLLITDKKEYKTPVMNIKGNGIKSIQIDNAPITPLNIFGWKIGWLGTYIIFSIVFSMTLRKILKLH